LYLLFYYNKSKIYPPYSTYPKVFVADHRSDRLHRSYSIRSPVVGGHITCCQLWIRTQPFIILIDDVAVFFVCRWL